MKKYLKNSQILYIAIAVTAFIPVSNLFAGEWTSVNTVPDMYDYSYENGTAYTKTDKTNINTYNPDYEQHLDEMELECELYSWSKAGAGSEQDPYTAYGEANAEVWILWQKDWEWEGVPAEATGAEIQITIDIEAAQDSNCACYDVQEADLYAYGRNDVLGYIAAQDEGGANLSANELDIQGYADNYGADYYYYYYLGYTDYEDWDLEEIGDNNYWAIVDPWLYHDDIYYEVESEITSFSVMFWAAIRSYSYAEIDYDGGELWPDAWSEQKNDLTFEAECIIYFD